MTRRQFCYMLMASVAGLLPGHLTAKTKSKGTVRRKGPDRKATPYRGGHSKSTSPKYGKRK